MTKKSNIYAPSKVDRTTGFDYRFQSPKRGGDMIFKRGVWNLPEHFIGTAGEETVVQFDLLVRRLTAADPKDRSSLVQEYGPMLSRMQRDLFLPNTKVGRWFFRPIDEGYCNCVALAVMASPLDGCYWPGDRREDVVTHLTSLITISTWIGVRAVEIGIGGRLISVRDIEQSKPLSDLLLV